MRPMEYDWWESLVAAGRRHQSHFLREEEPDTAAVERQFRRSGTYYLPVLDQTQSCRALRCAAGGAQLSGGFRCWDVRRPPADPAQLLGEYHLLILEQDGVFIGFLDIVLLRTILAVKPVLEECREAVYELETIFNASQDGLHITDEKGVSIRLNRACEELMEFSREQVIGRHLDKIVEQGLIPEAAALKALEKREQVSRLQYFESGKAVLITATPIFRNGEIYRVLVNNRDITELNELEREVATAQSLAGHYRQELESLRGQHLDAGQIVYRSAEMKRLIEFSGFVARVDSTILIQGESGVGKELFSRLIHKASPRRSKAFIKIDCAAIPENLMESELFGYERGAFTGASREGKPGMIELADRGTLFLDEIGELPLALQAKLLRVLQDGEIIRVGGKQSRKVNLRIIAATNRNLDQMVELKTFRSDLYYRLNVIPLSLPPLRERREDIEPLVWHLIEGLNKKYSFHKRIGPAAMALLTDYHWPGNVRELKNIVERLVVSTLGNTINEADIPDYIAEKSMTTAAARELFTRLDSYEEMMGAFEKRLLLFIRQRCRNTGEMAEMLKVDRSTVRRKMNRHGIAFLFDSGGRTASSSPAWDGTAAVQGSEEDKRLL